MNLIFIKLYNQENLSLMEVHRKFIKLWFSCSRAEYFFISSEESEVGNNFNEVATIYAWIKGFIVSTQHDFNDNIIFFHQKTFMFEFQHGWVIVTVSDKKNTPFWLGQLNCPPNSFVCPETGQKKHTLINPDFYVIMNFQIFEKLVENIKLKFKKYLKKRN